MSAAVLNDVRIELDRLVTTGRQVGFWWRDDDAVAEGPALERLLAITGSANVPLSLAVIPAKAQASLADRLAGEDDVTVLVHGLHHANHTAPGERKAEFGANRPIQAMLGEAADALAHIAGLFGERALPVFVPPWNRIAPELAAQLSPLGYRALSCFGERPATPGIARIDTHLDPVDWHGSGSLAGPETLVAMIQRALSRGAERIGLLTHHLVFDEALWSFCEGMSDMARSHPGIRPIGLAEILEQPVRLPRADGRLAGASL